MTFATGLFLSPDKHAECDYGQNSSHREVHIFPGTERILTMFCMTDTNRDKRQTGRAQQQYYSEPQPPLQDSKPRAGLHV